MAGLRSGAGRRAGGLVWWPARDADPARVGPLLGAALDALASGSARNRKRGRRKALYPLRLESDDAADASAPGETPTAVAGADHLLKVSRYAWADGLRRRLAGSKARRELRRAQAAAARGVPTPVPLAAAEERRAGAVRACYLLVRVLPGFEELAAVWLGRALPPAERRALVAAFGDLTRRVHDAGLFQDDFAPNNFLVRCGPEPELRVIDFERARLRRRNGAAARRFMLAKVDRELAGAPAGDRMRFLLAYAQGERAEARTWWRRLERDAARLARRDFAHLTRAVGGSGRRFRAFARGGWRGLARADADPAAFAPALDATALSEGGALATPRHWVLELAGGKREVRRALARATLLAKRGGLAPRPLAAAHRAGRVRLLLERTSEEQPLADAPDRAAARRALAVLAERLLRLGRLDAAGLAPERLCVTPGPEGALVARWLPGPELRLPGRGDPAPRRWARELAERLLP